MTAVRGELPLRVIRTSLAAPLELRCRCGRAIPAASTPDLIIMAAHAAQCAPGRDQASRSPAPLAGEQPVRLVKAGWDTLLVCVCGAEAAQCWWGPTSWSIAFKTSGRRTRLVEDLTLDGLAVLLVHAATRCPAAAAWPASLGAAS